MALLPPPQQPMQSAPPAPPSAAVPGPVMPVAAPQPTTPPPAAAQPAPQPQGQQAPSQPMGQPPQSPAQPQESAQDAEHGHSPMPHRRIFSGLTLAFNSAAPINKEWRDVPPWVTMPTAAHVLALKLAKEG